MSKIDIMRKLTSRKFLEAVFIQIVCLVTAFGMDAHLAQVIASLVIMGVVAVAYIYTEGKVDASRQAVELIETEPDPVSEDVEEVQP